MMGKLVDELGVVKKEGEMNCGRLVSFPGPKLGKHQGAVEQMGGEERGAQCTPLSIESTVDSRTGLVGQPSIGGKRLLSRDRNRPHASLQVVGADWAEAEAAAGALARARVKATTKAMCEPEGGVGARTRAVARAMRWGHGLQSSQAQDQGWAGMMSRG